MEQVRAKKALGQHFLTDAGIGRRIASTLDEYVGMPVIEVGPGMGFLSRFLLDAGHDLTVVEIDGESVEYLRREFPALAEGERILPVDFLQTDLATLFPDGQPFCVIGNYPYNISSQIFFHILEYRDRIPCCSGMLQREVAERLAAKPGGRDRGILSVLLQAWYDVEYLFTVPENVFNPPPKVKSGVIKLTRNDRTALGCDERRFKTVVKTAFGQRRKMLRSSLKGLFGPGGIPAEISELMTMRPEQLSVDDFVGLTNIIETSHHSEA